MTPTYNVYCDESAHQEHDHHRVMVLGAVWCPLDRTPDITGRLREIKLAHGAAPGFEAKWTKVSPGGLPLYRSLIDYFFDDDDLHFRALVVPDKSLLHHDAFRQSHDDWYYKMYFQMLTAILRPHSRYRIYLDIKDTRSAPKIAKLHEMLAHSVYDFSFDIIERVQSVRSHEVAVLQLADLLMGAVSYANRGLASSDAKRQLVARIKERSGYSLQRTTLALEEKTNLLVWKPAPVST